VAVVFLPGIIQCDGVIEGAHSRTFCFMRQLALVFTLMLSSFLNRIKKMRGASDGRLESPGKCQHSDLAVQ
jgi:hypothetical protein